MKRLFSLAMLLMMTVAAFAQADNKKMTDEEFFLGKWTLLVEGLPTGDAEMLLVLTKNADGKLCGTIGDAAASMLIPLTKTEIEDGTLNVVFNGSGYDVPLYLDRQDDGTVSGSMNDMFDIIGKRYVEPKE